MIVYSKPGVQKHSFRYLDVQKTGSRFVIDFLVKHLNYVPPAQRDHVPVTKAVDPDTYYFITARDPVALYVSLYRYGLDRKGAVYKNMMKSGTADLYTGTSDDFHRWLDLMLDERNPPTGFGSTEPDCIPLFGLMTLRYLRLSVWRWRRRHRNCTSADDVMALYRKHKFVDAVLFNEMLSDDLNALIAGPLRAHVVDPEAAREALAAGNRVNASHSGSVNALRPSPDAIARIVEREWFFYKEFHYMPPALGEA